MVTDSHIVVAGAKQLPAQNLGGQLHPLVAQMMQNSPTAETAEKLLAMQERWEANEAKKAFNIAIVALKREMPAWIPRDAVVDYAGGKGRVHYTHASLAGAMETVLPHLVKHGFSISWEPATDAAGKVSVTAELTHSGGHSKKATISGPPDTSGMKSGPQAVASTITLLERYSFLALLGLATADMKEPGDEPPPPDAGSDRVDTARNMRAMSNLAKYGKTKADAEKYVGKLITQWTDAEISKLRQWVEPDKAPAVAAMAAEEPEMVDPAAAEASLGPPGLPPPPATPKDGDTWQEVVQVVEITPKKHPTQGAYVALRIRHIDNGETDHNCWKAEAADVARSIAGKLDTAIATFAAKVSKDKKLFINVEAMEPTPTEDTPF